MLFRGARVLVYSHCIENKFKELILRLNECQKFALENDISIIATVDVPMFYGFFLQRCKGHTFKSIATEQGVSLSRVSQIVQKGFRVCRSSSFKNKDESTRATLMSIDYSVVSKFGIKSEIEYMKALSKSLDNLKV